MLSLTEEAPGGTGDLAFESCCVTSWFAGCSDCRRLGGIEGL